MPIAKTKRKPMTARIKKSRSFFIYIPPLLYCIQYIKGERGMCRQYALGLKRV